MKYELIISRQAQIDAIEIADWYELQTPQTGERFYQALEEQFEMMTIFPGIYRANHATSIRKSKMAHWPYFVFFVCSEHLIEVLAIIHTSRDPNHIAARLES